MATTEYDLSALLASVASYGGSDVHLMHGMPPIARIAGAIKGLPFPPLTSETILSLLNPYITEVQKGIFQKENRVNCGHTIGEGRYRFNIYMSLGTVGASIRILPVKTYPLSSLGLPPIVGTLAYRKSGIVFVTGPTGSGKSTTMAAMLDCINQDGRPSKIVTIEDPVETIFKPFHSVFVQREVGTDTPSFAMGIMDSIRQDPDVLCIGELRDEKSIYAAMAAAETGHLVLTTLHSPSVAQTMERIVGVFEGPAQRQIILQLANSLQGIIVQDLLPSADRNSRVLAYELLMANGAVRNLIRENQIHMLENCLQTGGKEGMTTMDNCLYDLYCRCLISYDTAVSRAKHPDRFSKRAG